MKQKTSAQQRGQWAELYAQNYLRQQGLSDVQQNYQGRFGEIDLIMLHNDILVFIEVRYRRSQQYGGGIESVNATKQQRIIKTAWRFLQKNPTYQQYDCRFDVITLSGKMDKPELDWLADAFRLN